MATANIICIFAEDAFMFTQQKIVQDKIVIRKIALKDILENVGTLKVADTEIIVITNMIAFSCGESSQRQCRSI